MSPNYIIYPFYFLQKLFPVCIVAKFLVDSNLKYRETFSRPNDSKEKAEKHREPIYFLYSSIFYYGIVKISKMKQIVSIRSA